MLVTLFTHTPPAVWVLLIVLLALGLRQRRARRVGRQRALLLPAAFGAFSLYGASALAGAAPLTAWALAATIAIVFVLRQPVPAATHYDHAQGEFFLPGSSVPLILMMSAFVLNYAVNVALALHPTLRQDSAAAVTICTAYGLLSGLFLGRAVRLWKLSAKSPA